MFERSLVVALVSGLIWAAGCTQPSGSLNDADETRPNLEIRASPVQKVVCLYAPTPQQFKSLDREGDPNPEGFSCTLYLVSRRTGKGILADGLIQARMYRVVVLEDGAVERTLVFESAAVPTATVTHSMAPSAFGWAYVPIFFWGDADVLGQEVEIVIEYEAPSGARIQSKTHSFKVPARKL